jgi:hypothetical protein
MDQDTPSAYQPTSSASSSRKKPTTPTPTSQPRRSPRTASSIIIPTKPNPLLKPQKQRQPAATTRSLERAQLVKNANKPAMHVHRMLRSEIPGDAIGIQVCQQFPLIVLLLRNI